MTDENLTPQQKAAKTRAANKAKKDAEAKQALPVETTFGIVRKKDGWYAVTVETSGDDFVKREETGPLMRALAIEEYKINAQRHFDRME